MLVDYRKALTRILDYAKQATSVVSDAIAIFIPQWAKAENAWKGYNLAKKAMFATVIAGSVFLALKFSVDIGRLSLGSYRSAYAYGHGQSVTKSDISGMAHMSDISRIQRQVDEIKSQLSKIDDTIDKAQASRITTGSIQQPKK